MGHRKNRKRERRTGGTRERPDVAVFDPFPDSDWLLMDDEMESLSALTGRAFAPAKNTCGSCREFVEDHEGGRGTCLHPGSGVLSPWTDTDACDFYNGQRGRR